MDMDMNMDMITQFCILMSLPRQRSWVKSEISIVALATSNHCKDETIKCTQTYPE